MNSNIFFGEALAKQQHLIDSLMPNSPSLPLSAFVDGRGLACPMPLLKLKIALRTADITDSVIYLVASDKNSLTDISAFCQKNSLILHSWQNTQTENTETIFHFIITKNTGVKSHSPLQ